MNLIYLIVEVWILWDTEVNFLVFIFCSDGGDKDFLNYSWWKCTQELRTWPTLKSQSSLHVLSHLTYDWLLLNLCVLFSWWIQFCKSCQTLLYPGGAIGKSQLIYLGRAISPALCVCWWLHTTQCEFRLCFYLLLYLWWILAHRLWREFDTMLS